MSNNPGNWQTLLWHEWRHCRDEDYRRELQKIVERQPIGVGNILLDTMVNALPYAMSLSCLGYFFHRVEHIDPDILEFIVEIWTGPWALVCYCIGCAVAMCPRVILRFRHRMTRRSSTKLLSFPNGTFFVPNGLWLLAIIIILFETRSEALSWLVVLALAYVILVPLCVLADLGTSLSEDDPNTLEHGPRKWWTPRFRSNSAPLACDVEPAFRCIVDTRIEGWEQWVSVLARLEARRSDALETLLTLLDDSDWVERLVARQHLIARGGEVCEFLEQQFKWDDDRILRGASWALEKIASQTKREVRSHMSFLLCPEHAMRPSAHRAETVRRTWEGKWKDASVTWYGCRACGRSRDLQRWTGDIVAVLDAGMTNSYVEQDSQLRINWLAHRFVFDFDGVEIVNATDEDVARFVIQVDNDTDPVRCGRYQKMHCLVSPDCRLSENTRRILRDTFKRVVQKKRPGRGASR